MDLYIVLLILVIHWIADFVLQSSVWAVGKSNDVLLLLKHTALYSAVWYLPMLFILGPHNALYFVVITFFTHTIVDYHTSKIVQNKFKNNYLGKSIPNFGAFCMIGLDQTLHYAQLFITFLLLC